jgi:hypothetical protein
MAIGDLFLEGKEMPKNIIFGKNVDLCLFI